MPAINIAKQKKVSLKAVSDFGAEAGQGVYGSVDGKKILAGNRRMMDAQGIELGALAQKGEEAAEQGKTPLYFACDGKIIPIQWHHDSYEEPFQYTLEDGSPLYLGVGTAYIAVLGGDPISYK